MIQQEPACWLFQTPYKTLSGFIGSTWNLAFKLERLHYKVCDDVVYKVGQKAEYNHYNIGAPARFITEHTDSNP
jgi:hypothetical protein